MPENKENQSQRSNEANKREEPDRGTQAKTGQEDRAIDSQDVAEATVEGFGGEATEEEKE